MSWLDLEVLSPPMFPKDLVASMKRAVKSKCVLIELCCTVSSEVRFSVSLNSNLTASSEAEGMYEGFAILKYVANSVRVLLKQMLLQRQQRRRLRGQVLQIARIVADPDVFKEDILSFDATQGDHALESVRQHDST